MIVDRDITWKEKINERINLSTYYLFYSFLSLEFGDCNIMTEDLFWIFKMEIITYQLRKTTTTMMMKTELITLSYGEKKASLVWR